MTNIITQIMLENLIAGASNGFFSNSSEYNIASSAKKSDKL